MGDPPRVVLLSLDAFNPLAVSPGLTPRLWALAAAGGGTPAGGRCDLPAVTYPSHATLLTGRLPSHHGVRSNLAASPRPGTVPGWAGEVRVGAPTLFDACRAAHLRSAAILGDQKLFPILGAGAADRVWPAGGVVPAGTPVDAYGYPTNVAVRPHLLAALADASLRFVFGHLNETDTWGHRLGPDHPETRAAYAATDALVGEALDALADGWDRTLLIVVSDHGMEPVGDGLPIDLLAAADVRAVVAEVVAEGGCAVARLRDGVEVALAGAALAHAPGVAAWREVAPGTLLVEARPGGLFASGPSKHLRGVHGGPGTARTLALVGGGHPIVPAIAASIRARPPHLADWAPTVATVLGLDLSDVDGSDLAVG